MKSTGIFPSQQNGNTIQCCWYTVQ